MIESRRYKLGRLESDLEARGIDPSSLAEGATTLDRAEDELRERNSVAFLHFLFVADRLVVYALEELDRPELILGEAHDTLGEAHEALSGWRLQAVQSLLPSFESDEVPSVSELNAAKQLLHDSYESLVLRAEFLHGQLLFFFASTAVALVLLGVYVFVSLPGSNLPVFGASRPLTGAGADVDAPHYLVPVALFGVLGASVNGLRSVVRLFREKSVSAYYLVDPTVFHTARILIGAVSALAVFTFLRSGVLQLGPELTPGLVLAAAFTSGVSESLLNRAVEAIAGDAVREGVASTVER